MGEAGKDALRVGLDRTIMLAFHDLTGRDNGQYDDRIRTRAVVRDRQPSNRPIRHADRRLYAPGGGIQAVMDAERLGFLGAV